MDKASKVGRIYRIVMTIYPILLGLFSITMTWSIYFANQGSEVVFRDKDINPVLVSILLMVALYVVMIIGSLFLTKDKEERKLGTSLYHQWRKHRDNLKTAPSYKKTRRKLVILTSITGGIALLALAMAILFFALFEFDGSITYLEQSMVVLSHVLPWVFVIFVCYTVWKFVFEYELSRLISETRPIKREDVSNNPWVKNSIRIVILTLAIVFIVIGICGKGYQDVLSKASKICLECLGIG